MNPDIEFDAKSLMLQTVNNHSFGRHLACSLPKDEGVKCQHELVMP